LVQLLATLSSGGLATVAPPTQEVAALVPNGPPNAPPGAPSGPTSAVAVPQAANNLESARQQLDAASRQLAASLDDQWKQYLALPAEIYIPNHAPSVESIEQAISRYESVSENPQYAALSNQAAFQATLKGLWRLGEVQQGAQQKLRLPPPPLGAKSP
jgi:hypothetical protein